MLLGKVKVVNSLGLHARAAAQLVRLAGKFKSRIEIKKIDGDISANAKSILSVLNLAAAKGTRLGVEVEGKDEKEALAAIKELFVNGFGEITK